MAKKPFLVAGLLGRGLRFGLEAVLIGLYGEQALEALVWFLDNELLLAAALVLSGLATWWLWFWWTNLGQQPPTGESESLA